MKRITALLKKHRGKLAFLVFGLLTTVVNYAVYLPLHNGAGLSGTASNAVAWVAAVAFAYLTNKPFVFGSHDWSAKTVIPELGRFLGCRFGSGLIETGLIFVLVDLLCMDGTLIKLLASLLVVAINYIASKWVVFKSKEE